MYYYISFATDAGFRGATVVKAQSEGGALEVATLLGLNPGGEAAILPVPKDAEQEPDMRAMVNRLVGRDEMIANGGKRHGDCPDQIQTEFEKAVTIICNDCNVAKP